MVKEQVTRSENDQLLSQAKHVNHRNSVIITIVNLIFSGFGAYYLMQFIISCQQHANGQNPMNTCNLNALISLHTTLVWMMLFNIAVGFMFKPQWQAQISSVMFILQRLFWLFFTAGSMVGLHYAAKSIIKFVGNPGPISSWLTDIYQNMTLLSIVNDFFGLIFVILLLIGGGISTMSAEDAAWNKYAMSGIHYDLLSIQNSL